MPTRIVATKIRLGELSLAVASLLLFLTSATASVSAGSGVDPRAFAEEASSPIFTLAIMVHMVVNVLAIFGFFGLYVYLAGSRVEGWAFIGMVLCVVAFAVNLVLDGVYLTLPEVGQRYLEGERGALEAFNAFSESTIATVLSSLPVLLFPAFTIFYSVAIWQSGELP